MDRELSQSQLTRRRMLKITAAGTASLGAGTLLAACAAPATTSSPTPAAATPSPAATPTTRALEKVSFTMAFRTGATDSYWFLAKERGYFAAEGLDVDIIEGSGSATSARIVGAGSSTFGVVDGGVIIRSAGAGIPIRAICGVFQTGASAAIVRRDSGITKPKDLEGKTVGHGTGSASGQLFPGWMRLNGANPDTVTVRILQPPTENQLFIQGQLDSVLTFVTGSLQTIQAQVDAIPIKYSDFGFNVPGNCIVANALTIRDRPELVRAFATAAAKGMEDSVKDPQAALDALVKAVPALDSQRAILIKSIETANTLTRTERTQGRRLGWMSAEDWGTAINLLKQYGGLTDVPKVEEVISNQIPER